MRNSTCCLAQNSIGKISTVGGKKRQEKKDHKILNEGNVFLLLCDVLAPRIVVERVRNPVACVFRILCLQTVAKSMFWHLLPATAIGGQVPQVYRLPQISTDEWLDKKRLFDEKAESDWSQLVLMRVRAKATRESVLKIFGLLMSRTNSMWLAIPD